MSGTPTVRRRPTLLLLVYGAVLVLVGITATAQAVLVSSRFTTTTFEAILDSDAATIQRVVSDELEAADLDPARISVARVRALETLLQDLTARDTLVRAELRAASGTIIAASEPGMDGVIVARDEAFLNALAGRPEAAIHPGHAAGTGPIPLDVGSVLREDLPLALDDGTVPAVLIVWRDAGPILAQLDGVGRDVVTLTLVAAIVAAILLTLIFRSAQGRLSRQADALVLATRTDSLTGLLNHGTLVEDLSARISRAQATGGSIGVALFDLDNFKLLNDTHGHVVGDEALVALADVLREHAPAGSAIGRFGPDEFLVVGEAGRADDLAPAVERMRASLGELAASLPGHDPLPLTVSAALARYPDDGGAANLLLASLVATLEFARASGGDQVQVAGSNRAAASPTSSFDVYQGLVFAIDTKDRYTRRHSEDVARYAMFIGRRLGLDDAMLETIRTAGLLHDVGKIGIPDEILRKPSRLTAEEADTIKQHVALGDMIVRDLPGIDDIRRAVRHHHERWDGNGYLDALAGEDIPFIARILSVADTFSAMTTTRPYRKALDLAEAIARLGDAAGTQLDEVLVRTFLDGLEQDADAPIPGAARPALWTPRIQVA